MYNYMYSTTFNNEIYLDKLESSDYASKVVLYIIQNHKIEKSN